MPTIDEIKQDLLAACRIIATEGLADAFAHVSARVPGTQSMAFMPGKSPALVTYADLFVVGLDELVPQSAVHQAIYRARPDVGAIIHAHPPRAIALSLVGETIRPVHNNSAMFWQGVPLDSTTGRVGGRQRAEEIAQLLGQSRAIMMRGHGVTTVAENVRDACMLVIYIEETARMLLEVAPLGRPLDIPQEVAAAFAPEAFSAASNQRAWEHFKRRAGVA